VDVTGLEARLNELPDKLAGIVLIGDQDDTVR